MAEPVRPVDIVVLTSHKPHHYALLHALAERHHVKAVVFDDVVSRRPRMFRRRLKKLGPVAVMDQLLFKVVDTMFLQPAAQERRNEILGPHTDWDPTFLGEIPIVDAGSVNRVRTIDIVRNARPRVIVVSGTGILADRFIDAVRPAPIINVHCGITPRYRGTHGGFWAVVQEDWDNVGVTVHYLDKGIDTGRILAQASLDLEPKDNPRTLVLKQYQKAIPLTLDLVSRLAAGDEQTVDRPDLDSRIYSSPRFSAYLKFRRLMRQLPDASRGLR